MPEARAQLELRTEAQVSAASGDHTPLWLNANKYGLSSLDKTNGYLRAGVFHQLDSSRTEKLDWGYGADVAVASGFTSTLVVQQAFVEGRWLHGVLTVGSKEQPMELKNQELSSGSQTFGINARPVPQVRLALPDYWDIPHTKGLLALKGHIAYGKTTDDSWQKDFTGGQPGFTEGVLYHSKAGFLRVGSRRISLEMGLEMACTFGGTSYMRNGKVVKAKTGVSSFAKAFVPGGADATDAGYDNAEGNHVGSWLARLNICQDDWQLGLYADHYFEDQSGMFFLDYDGYGTGNEWNDMKDSRFFLYDLKDMLLGGELKLKRGRWINGVVVEFLSTKYQSGPVYHDHTPNVSSHISGRDNYYNHFIYTGWQHWGQVMGNPLYLSPIYNDNGVIEVCDNRFTAWHLGLSGDPAKGLHYRLLATMQKGYGTYDYMYPDPRRNFSLLLETSYRFPVASKLNGWSVKAAVGMDRGKLLGDNMGLQLTVGKNCWLLTKKKN